MNHRRLLRRPEVLRLLNCGNTKFHEMQKAGLFPAPILLPCGRTKYWDSVEVDAWLQAQIDASRVEISIAASTGLNALFGRSAASKQVTERRVLPMVGSVRSVPVLKNVVHSMAR